MRLLGQPLRLQYQNTASTSARQRYIKLRYKLLYPAYTDSSARGFKLMDIMPAEEGVGFLLAGFWIAPDNQNAWHDTIIVKSGSRRALFAIL